MFESQQREDVEALMRSDTEFRRLFHRHQELDSKVHDAEIGALPMDADTLSSMKREKLLAKSRLMRMWETHRHRVSN
ncbi:MAG TPA: YdcH family protein [Rhodanobacteraceae bacterium]